VAASTNRNARQSEIAPSDRISSARAVGVVAGLVDVKPIVGGARQDETSPKTLLECGMT